RRREERHLESGGLGIATTGQTRGRSQCEKGEQRLLPIVHSIPRVLKIKLLPGSPFQHEPNLQGVRLQHCDKRCNLEFGDSAYIPWLRRVPESTIVESYRKPSTRMMSLPALFTCAHAIHFSSGETDKQVPPNAAFLLVRTMRRVAWLSKSKYRISAGCS